MAKKLYYPTLVRILHKVCVYIVRYRAQLEEALTDAFGASAVTALNAVVVACETFTSIVELSEGP